MVSVFHDQYFLFPVVTLVFIGAVVLLCRWAFSGTSGSLVRRIDHSPADRDTFGLLVDVHTSTTYAEARRTVSLLANREIKATAARTTDGWSVYVWPTDEAAARDIVKKG